MLFNNFSKTCKIVFVNNTLMSVVVTIGGIYGACTFKRWYKSKFRHLVGKVVCSRKNLQLMYLFCHRSCSSVNHSMEGRIQGNLYREFMSLIHGRSPTFDEISVVYYSGPRRRRRLISAENDEEETGHESGDSNRDDLVRDHDFEESREKEWKCTLGSLVNLRLWFFQRDLYIFFSFFYSETSMVRRNISSRRKPKIWDE